MNQILQNLQPPNPPSPASLGEKPSFTALTAVVKALLTWAQNFSNWLVNNLQTIRTQINTQVQGVGAPLASDATITPTAAFHHVTGTAAIASITVPGGFSGNIWLIPDDLWVMVTGGNIAADVTAVINKVLGMTFDPNTDLWYPSYFS